MISPQKHLPSKWSSGSVEGSFDDPPDSGVPNITSKITIPRIISKNIQFLALRTPYWQPCHNFRPVFRFFGREPENKDKTLKFSPKKIPLKCSSGTVDCSFENQAEIFREFSDFFGKHLKIRMKLKHFRKNTSPKMFLWRRRLHFRRPCWRKVAESWKNFTQIPENFWNHFSQKIPFLNR